MPLRLWRARIEERSLDMIVASAVPELLFEIVVGMTLGFSYRKMVIGSGGTVSEGLVVLYKSYSIEAREEDRKNERTQAIPISDDIPCLITSPCAYICIHLDPMFRNPRCAMSIDQQRILDSSTLPKPHASQMNLPRRGQDRYTKLHHLICTIMTATKGHKW